MAFMKKGFLTNKYTVSVFILLTILAIDILLHKGMSRTILPESFTSKRAAQTNLPACNHSLISKGKSWLKAINSPDLMLVIDSNTNGIEIDVYFDTAFNRFFVYHDSSAVSKITINDILEIRRSRQMEASIWVDFKNLTEANKQQALTRLVELRETYGFRNKMIVESPDAKSLSIFCDSGFFTSYYVPFFNPYQEDENNLVARIDSISAMLKQYPVSALSGYYFQTAFLKKFFPAFPILTWTDDSKISLVNNLFNQRLEADENVKIVLHPFEN